jgi:thiol-disulfide isomerase/thioredoxin
LLAANVANAGDDKAAALGDDPEECNVCPTGSLDWDPKAGGAVVPLELSNFTQKTKSGFWMVEFYAPWCKHCKELAPILEEAALAEGVKGKMRLAKIDSTTEENKPLVKKLGVVGFPKLFWSRGGGEWASYRGPKKKAADFVAFVEHMEKDPVAVLSSQAEVEAVTETVWYFLGLRDSAGKEPEQRDVLARHFLTAAKGMQDTLTFGESGDAALLGTPGMFADAPKGPSFIARVEGRKVSYFTGKTKFAGTLKKWVTSTRFPDVIDLTSKVKGPSRSCVLYVLFPSQRNLTECLPACLPSSASLASAGLPRGHARVPRAGAGGRQ